MLPLCWVNDIFYASNVIVWWQTWKPSVRAALKFLKNGSKWLHLFRSDLTGDTNNYLAWNPTKYCLKSEKVKEMVLKNELNLKIDSKWFILLLWVFFLQYRIVGCSSMCPKVHENRNEKSTFYSKIHKKS